MLAGVDELLRQQIAETAGRLDGPGALREGLCPRDQIFCLMASGSYSHHAELALVTADGNCCVSRLVGINADDDAHEYLLARWLGTARALLIWIVVHVPLSSHSTART